MNQHKFAVIDLETIGNAPKRGDRIIQFAAVVIENGKIIEQYSSFINPEQQIPPFIEELTGINDEMVKDAPLFSEIAPKILTMLDDAYFVAHNVLFDLSFLQEELIHAGYEGFFGPVLDTVELARILLPTADSYKLSDLALKEKLSHDRPHQADSDAYVTAELLLILLDKLQKIPLCTMRQLYKLSDGLKSDLHMLLGDMIMNKEQTIEVLPESIEIFRGIALKKKKNLPKNVSIPSQIEYPVDIESKEALFQKAFQVFEKRTGQFQMMDAVYRSLLNQQHSLIEAGTGVGKSIAYLIPAAIFSRLKNKPVVISTYTTQLQEQLLTRDIPLLNKMFSFPVKTVLLKGRNHYLSLYKFELSLKEEDDNYDTCLTKMQILIWLLETETGDYEELNLSSGGRLFWNQIKNDETSFLQGKAWFSHDYYLRARNEAQTADLIITNHALLLSDAASEQPILPDYHFAIIDEGHLFEKAAGKQFGISLDYLAIRHLLGRLGTYEQKQLFYRFEQLLNDLNWASGDIVHTFVVNQTILDLSFEFDELFKIISFYAEKKTKDRDLTFNKIKYRITNFESGKEWIALQAVTERILFLLKDLLCLFEKRLNVIKQLKDKLSVEHKGMLEDMASVLKELKEIKDAVKHLFIIQQPEYVIWIETDVRAFQNATAVYAQPIHVSSYLKRQFFDVKKSVVITSATLTVNNSFKFIVRELGIENHDYHTEIIPSPFRYSEQVQLVIPEDLPEINAVSAEEYTASITEQIISIAEATKGRMLILFTAYDMLKKTYELMKESGFLEEYVLIAQGISGGSRTRLTRNFQRFDKAILFGTNSFWEGVDIPGEDLSCLIIVRLPFFPPDEPVIQAKCEAIKKNGGNPFFDHSLPEAVIRFKQGFGRLIRSEQDRGIIVVFDRRIITTRYGKTFLNSIPKIPVKKSNIDELVQFIHSWL
ncbi:ATP-dependent DNA helicase/DNA polymerase III subunit epsilon [Bacillus methanolicus PB1]|uniref:3'-5' exonuclease DinG n=1 Tax=Bacillus methanolicus PB1 TaxID=997296 RepID=I3DWN1_BACMT|nr:ATP-dependent DNA helicase DinG [Bacillus methanolicus]EIJ78652.1 ATP-dependent DNA helicase/DNA polymerase III subunit epsilon [Bacillus methanolicus PB1]